MFNDTVDAAFGSQTFNIVAYQCVAPECDNDFDRSVFENQDRWLLEAALGIEVRMPVRLVLCTCVSPIFFGIELTSRELSRPQSTAGLEPRK